MDMLFASYRSGWLNSDWLHLTPWEETQAMWTIVLLIGSNIFMTFAWYGHLKFREVPLWKVILVSWGIAFFEYCLQVPANRIGAKTFSPDQLKVIQEVITLTVFGVFSTFYFGDKLHWNHFAAFGCLVAGAFFMFHKF
jgi:uncharacterized protein (DUF486 family)